MPTTLALTNADIAAEVKIGRALFATGDYDELLAVIEPFLRRPTKDALSRFAAFQLKACVHSERQEWLACLDVLRLSGPLVDEMPSDLRAKYYGQRALAHRKVNQVDAALLDYEAARDAAFEAADQKTVAGIRNNIASIYGRMGRVDEAIVEVDAAIKMAIRINDDVSLGRFYDNKAQILNIAKRNAEALACSKKAVSLLVHHPAGVEARFTHGLILIGLGAEYLHAPQSVEQYRAIHDAAKMIDVELNEELVRSALAQSNGHVLAAAQLLNVSHSAIIKRIGKHELDRVPKRRRAKSLIAK